MSSSPARFPEKGPFLSKQWSSGSLMRGLSFLNDQKEKEKLEYGDILAVPKLPIYIYIYFSFFGHSPIYNHSVQPTAKVAKARLEKLKNESSAAPGTPAAGGKTHSPVQSHGSPACASADTPQRLATPLDKSPKFDKDWYRWKTIETLSTFRWCFVSIPLGSPPLPMHATCAGCPGSRRAGGCPKRPWWAHGWWGGSTNISHICMYIIVYIHI